MFRRFLCSTLLIALCSSAGAAQEAPVPTRIYVATFRISYADVPEWTETYFTHMAPILQSLVEEGVITNFNLAMHHTGGEYNVRQGFFGNDDTDYDLFWEQYLGRYQRANPEAFERTMRMIEAHQDEIFGMDSLRIQPGDAPPAFLYEAKFQLNFADIEEWNRLWEEEVLPVAERAMTDGHLRGYAIESHDTGGRFNWKVVWLFDEWDVIDDFLAALFEAVPPTHTMWGMFDFHEDELWETVAAPSN